MAAKTSTRVNPKSVTILAMGFTAGNYVHMIGAQFERPTKYVWAIDNSGMWFHDIDLIVAMDDFRRDAKTKPVNHRKYVDALTNRGVPIITSTAYKEYPCLEEYPLAEVLEYLGRKPWEHHPLDNSINYAIALAMYRGMKQIRLVGVEFVPPHKPSALEYAREVAKDKYGAVPDWFKYYMKPALRTPGEPGESNCTWLLEFAMARGISIGLQYGTTLMGLDIPVFYYG